MNEKLLVALITLGVACHAAYQAYAWLVGTLQHIVQSMP
jgi:hypothetical protein